MKIIYIFKSLIIHSLYSRVTIVDFPSKAENTPKNVEYARFLVLVLYLVMVIFFNCSMDKSPLIYNGNTGHNKILFTSNRSGKDQLYTVNPDGSGIQQMSSGQWWHSFARWSPDGTKIVCNTEEGTTTAGFQMVVMDADGSNRKLLGYGNQMAWHPDGNVIVFSFAPSLEIGIYGIYLYSINLQDFKRKRLPIDMEGWQSHFFTKWPIVTIRRT
ncbi:MAG: hypothetical protein U5R06_09795 [candidate division KSB1 bacterium]|nr:hypothetical protein [candidate division KSB1 bacterium]